MPPKYTEYKECYQKQCKKTALLNDGLFSQLDTIRSISSFDEKKAAFHALVQRVLADSEDAVDNIEAAIESQGLNYTVRYKASLIFDVDPLVPADTDEQMMMVWDQLSDDSIKTQINIIRFPSGMSDKGFIRYGFFYGVNSHKSKHTSVECGEILIGIYKKLGCIFDGKAYRTRAILLPDTPPGRMFEHNVQRNILHYAKKFTHRVIDSLKSCYRADVTQQFLLGSTNYVEEEFNHLVQNMGWDYNDQPVMVPSDDPFIQLTVYYNDYVKPEKGRKDITYSVVKILCGPISGTGFLLRVEDQILCITCNHILQYAHSSPLSAVSEYHNRIDFPLRPHKAILSYDEDELLPASDEVMILSPQWEGRIPFDLHELIALDDLDGNIGDYIGKYCSCCGYPEDNELLWSDPIKIRGRSTKEYYQMQIDEGDNPVQHGYSGGIVRLDQNPHCILGIHEGRHGDCSGLVIPNAVIKGEILRRQSYGKISRTND